MADERPLHQQIRDLARPSEHPDHVSGDEVIDKTVQEYESAVAYMGIDDAIAHLAEEVRKLEERRADPPPLSPREALWMIWEGTRDGFEALSAAHIADIAKEGLNSSTTVGYLEIDRILDYLASAERELRKRDAGLPLPPDLEATIDRRLSQGIGD